MSKIHDVYKALVFLEEKEGRGVSAMELSEYMDLDRANISRYLNGLNKSGELSKIEGRPVLYTANKDKKIQSNIINKNTLDRMVGAEGSLQVPIQQAKAAILYPPRGLHTLILGETGVGKSMFAELMHEFAIEAGVIEKNAPFVRFNCADYSDNPQLVMAQIFGVKKGAYTGADSNKDGLLKKAHGGIIFLDEIHRLSPQGQEMLFTYIDKGTFRPLGETENLIKVEAQIITATTEEPQSFLLKTFTRRIPMTITLPALKERSIKERYYLLEQFIKGESTRLSKSIYFNKNALISFLLYDCPNNIGQLKSDIQLACAKAFLNFKANARDYILIEQTDLPQRVNKGLMKLQQYRNEIDEILTNMGDVLRFSYKDDEKLLLRVDYNEDNYITGEYFYEIIESKLEELKGKGLEEKEINDILNIDIEKYFHKYIRDLPKEFRRDEIAKIVESEIVDTVEEILQIASQKLGRHYDEKVYFGLALHLQGSVERIRQGNKIYHPKLSFVRSHYAKEFIVAMEVAELIDRKFDIEVPFDEIGYLTMFIAAKPYEIDEKKSGTVGVLVIMHGHSTASSMVDVANSLIGENYTRALDMPLTMKAEEMYEIAKKEVMEMNSGKGVLLLVDMGSLTNFGSMIKEEVGIEVKAIDMVSTLLVIEAGRKAINGRGIKEIYKSCLEISRYGIQGIRNNVELKENLIVTACFTGEGSAERLRQVLLQRLVNRDKVKIVSLNILDREDFIDKIKSYREHYNIIAVVGTVSLHLDGIPFIPAPDIFAENGIEVLDEYIKREEDFKRITKSIDTQLQDIDGIELVQLVKDSIESMEENLGISISHEVKVGIIIHLCFLIENTISGGKGKNFEKLSEYRDEHSKEFILVKQSLRKIELTYNIRIADNELAFIVRMVRENDITV